jgi:hypothetical protein
MTPNRCWLALGRGRVICFSPHPEKTAGLEDFVRRGTRWAAGGGDPPDPPPARTAAP